MRYISTFLLLAACIAAPVSASTLTVSTGGSDANDGVTAPLRTLQAAANLLQPGDTLLIQAGTYTAGINIDQAGVTIRGQGEVILDGANAAAQTGIHIGPTTGITVDNVKVRNCRVFGIMVGDSSGVTISNCEASACGTTGILSGHASDLTIQGCSTFNNKGEHGIYCSESGDRLRILNNLVYGNAGSGLQVNATQDSPVASDPNQDGISTDCLIAGNVIHDNCALGGLAMNLAGVVHSTIVNNLIYSEPGGGIALWDDGMGAQFGSKNNQILHNTIVVNASRGLVGVQFASGSTGNQLIDNIIVVQNGNAIQADEAVQSNFNLLLGPGIANDGALADWRNATGNDQNSLSVDPMLGSDFRPRAGSPVIDAGTQVYPTDKDGQPRPQGANPDLGCYETASAGSVTIAPPTTPTGLQALAGDGRVDLRWDAAAGSTPPGYCIYRATSPTGPFTARTDSPVSAAAYTDLAVQNGTTYWYQICAVDGSGRASAPTAAVAATPAAPRPSTYSLSGTVRSGGSALAGVTVSAGTASATTAADGTYRIAGLAAGSYIVSARKSGYTFSATQSVALGTNLSGVNFTAQVPPTAGGAAIIYDDAPALHWISAAYRAAYSLSCGTPVKQGTRSISLTISAANGYVQLSGNSSSGLALAGRSALKFWIHGGATGGQPLQVRAVVDGSVQAAVNLASFGGLPQSNGWVEYTIPLSALNAAGRRLTGLRIGAPIPTKPAYLDYLRLE